MRSTSRSLERRCAGGSSPSRRRSPRASRAATSSIAALAYADGKVFLNTLDNQTIALDAANGKELWRYRSGDIRAGETRTMAPLVVKGRVLIGNSGGEYGVRGWLVALDAQKGKELWRAYSTGPDRDVLIGPDYKPFYAKDRGADLGVKTWPSDAWKIGGGTVWGWISYDADLDLVYYGTSNPGPWNAEQRPGDNKFTSGLFARDASTGQARWFYQLSPHDEFDYDAVNESVLVDLDDRRQAAQGSRPSRSQRLRLRDGSLDRRGAVGNAVRVGQHVHRRRPRDGFAALRARQTAANRHRGARHLPRLPGRQGLAALRVFAAHAVCSTSRTRISARTRRPTQTSYIVGTPYVGVDRQDKPGPGGIAELVTAWDPAAAKCASG